MKKTLTPRERLQRDGVVHRLADGRSVLMWSGNQPGKGRVVIVKPIGGRNATSR